MVFIFEFVKVGWHLAENQPPKYR